MSDRIAHIIAEIRDKFYHIKNELKQENEKYALLVNEIAALQSKQSELASVIVAKQNIVDALHLENLTLKKQVDELNLSLITQSDFNSHVVNHDELIISLVDEIDACISQLKK